jgi:hypothetical protein
MQRLVASICFIIMAMVTMAQAGGPDPEQRLAALSTCASGSCTTDNESLVVPECVDGTCQACNPGACPCDPNVDATCSLCKPCTFAVSDVHVERVTFAADDQGCLRDNVYVGGAVLRTPVGDFDLCGDSPFPASCNGSVFYCDQSGGLSDLSQAVERDFLPGLSWIVLHPLSLSGSPIVISAKQLAFFDGTTDDQGKASVVQYCAKVGTPLVANPLVDPPPAGTAPFVLPDLGPEKPCDASVFCGDAVLDADLGEACDDGAANGTAASCCTSTCTFQPPATPCTQGACDGAGTCVSTTTTTTVTTITVTTTTMSATTTSVPTTTSSTTTTLPSCDAVSCGHNGRLVCHVPPDDPLNRRTLCVGVAAVSAHLGHGDSCGSCR